MASSYTHRDRLMEADALEHPDDQRGQSGDGQQVTVAANEIQKGDPITAKPLHES